MTTRIDYATNILKSCGYGEDMSLTREGDGFAVNWKGVVRNFSHPEAETNAGWVQLFTERLDELVRLSSQGTEDTPTRQPMPTLQMIPWDEAMEVLAVFEYGAMKYEPRGWEGVSKEEHLAAAQRHLAHHLVGSKLDESGYASLAHAVARLLIVMWHEVKRQR